MLYFLFFILPWIGLCGRLYIVFTNPGENVIKSAVIDPTSGDMDRVHSMEFPPTECDPGWVLGNGTHGQTSETFYQNGSLFFFAQEHCGNTIQNTTLFIANPYNFAGRMFELAKFPELDQQPENSPLHYHISWDWVCNLIVVVRRYHEMNEQTTWDYRSIEVSAYDGAKRPLPDLGSDTSYCKNCWHWIDGVNGVDMTYPYHSNAINSSHHDNEENCGECVFYTLEEKIINYKNQKPRRLIGRGVHNGSVIVNATDRFQTQAMSYMPKNYYDHNGDYFIGLGVCCELSWCPRECEGHGGELLFVQWPHSNYSYNIMLTLGHKLDDLDEMTIKMGIATDIRGFPINSSTYVPRISLWMSKKIYTYELIYNEYGNAQAKQIAKSPSLSIKPLMWGYNGF